MAQPFITRATELFICAALKAAVPKHTFLPFHGGNATKDAFEFEPPFTVISISDAEKTHQTESTWLVKGVAQIVTQADDVASPLHAKLVQEIYAALDAIAPSAASAAFSFHGIDIERTSEAVDEEAMARADIIRFTCGVGG